MRPISSFQFLALIQQRFWHALSAAKWLAIVMPMAVVVGSTCALFLWALDAATAARFAHPLLLWGLPFAGVAIALAYQHLGRGAEGGNNLIVEQIHEPGGSVPLRMAPLILVATVLTHLFGGSVGREGTAVQLGGSIASAFARRLGLSSHDTRIVLMTGIAAGFGAVFGTPVAGAVFALEVLSVGRVEYDALVPCVLAAIVGDWTCHHLGVAHVGYHIAFAGYAADGPAPFHIDALLLAKVAVAGVVFGLAGLLFAEATHGAGSVLKRICPVGWLRPAIGGLLVIALVHALGTRAYLGLGVVSPDPSDSSILAFFGPLHFAWAWAWKLVFTVISLGSGFKGGEVTPLFFIGAGLGNALSGLMDAPVDLFAALGFVAIFAAASNTPLACTIMGIELFGATHTPYIAVACFVAYLCSGHSGIYLSQRVAVPKTGAAHLPPDIPLRQARGFMSAPRTVPWSLSTATREITAMTHHIQQGEIGMLRIYVRPKDRFVQPGQGRFKAAFSHRPLYQELIQQAKRAGLVNAVAHHTHYGFSNGGALLQHETEGMNPELTMCVELIAPRAALEAFCRDQGALLTGKVIVYKHLEHWCVGTGTCPVEEQVSDAGMLTGR